MCCCFSLWGSFLYLLAWGQQNSWVGTKNWTSEGWEVSDMSDWRGSFFCLQVGEHCFSPGERSDENNELKKKSIKHFFAWLCLIQKVGLARFRNTDRSCYRPWLHCASSLILQTHFNPEKPHSAAASTAAASQTQHQRLFFFLSPCLRPPPALFPASFFSSIAGWRGRRCASASFAFRTGCAIQGPPDRQELSSVWGAFESSGGKEMHAGSSEEGRTSHCLALISALDLSDV